MCSGVNRRAGTFFAKQFFAKEGIHNDLNNSSGLGKGEDCHYVETAEGTLIDAKGEKAQYVRLYSKGNNSNDLNHYIEVEVYGK